MRDLAKDMADEMDRRDAAASGERDTVEHRTAAAVMRSNGASEERIVRLFKQGNASYRAGRLYLALAAASDDPAVGEVVRRVSSNRLAYLYTCYLDLGLDPIDARLWSTFAYATFIGNQQVHRDTPDRFPSGPKFREYFKLMLRTLIPRGAPAERSAPRTVSALRKSA